MPRQVVAGIITVALAAVLVLVAMQLADGGGTDPLPPEPSETRAGATRVATALPFSQDLAVPCFGPPEVAVPEIPDLDDQYDVALEALEVADDVFEVVLAGPTHLGVVAVVDGDAAAARESLPRVTHVVPTTSALRGLDVEAQLREAVDDLLRPAESEVRRATDGLRGRQSVTRWPNAGAVVVGWAGPVPDDVLALDGEGDDGVRVVVVEVAYSAAELAAAARRVDRAVRRIDPRARVDTRVCADGSGLSVQVATRRSPPEVERAARDAVDLPVEVIAFPLG